MKCAVCPQRRFLPVSDEAIRWHLEGRDDAGRDFVMGAYPMLQDETCFFLAADFDKSHWQDDAAAFLETCRRMNLSAVLERSRSGNGGHVWLFFAEAVPAALARRLGSHVLTETMERRPDIGLDSYDRFFPNQDTLPQGGLGNLIALPLQKQPRERGGSVFLDEQFLPYPDQWAFLSGVGKIDLATVEQIVRNAERQGRIIGVRIALPDEEDAEPWTLSPSRRKEIRLDGPLPKSLELVLGDQIYLSKEQLTPALRNQLLRLAAFQNPEFYKAQAMRLPTHGKPRIVCCAEDHPQHVALPRGCLDDVQTLLAELRVEAVVRDERYAGVPLDVRFLRELRPEQETAARAMLGHDTGVLSATTAFGKTVVAAWLLARRGVNTLVLVHRRQLLEQWVERLSAFLDLPPKAIGRMGGGQRKLTGMRGCRSHPEPGAQGRRQGLRGPVRPSHRGRMPPPLRPELRAGCPAGESPIRHGIVRHGHAQGRPPSDHFHAMRPRATPRRRQGASCRARPFEHTVLVRPTSFRPLAAANPDMRIQFQELYSELAGDGERNRLICEEVVQAVREGRSPLVLTERNEHLDCLAARLAADIRHLVVLRGGASRKEAQATAARLAAIPENEQRALVATGRYIGEGFDDARLDTLFLTLPVSWRGTIAQYVGRLHRLHHAKREVRVYDYADLNVPMLARMFDRRCRGYEAVGYTVLLPASAVPGWPAEVPLPADSQWKNDYAASVQRLVRDGLDLPLAKLFVDAARPLPSDAEGTDRARSASEAFLYRRLETLPQAAGLFHLNARLPIPFDGWGQMEVDLLWAEGRVAIELDGPQHLDNLEAYRRDRRKDVALAGERLLRAAFPGRRLGPAARHGARHGPANVIAKEEVGWDPRSKAISERTGTIFLTFRANRLKDYPHDGWVMMSAGQDCQNGPNWKTFSWHLPFIDKAGNIRINL